ncbi:hypothetical protein [Azospirillum sp. sgz302134]
MDFLQKTATRRMFTVRRPFSGGPAALRSWGGRLARWKFLIAFIVLAGTAAALVYLKSAVPQYRAEAVMAIDTRIGPKIGPAAAPEEMRADVIALWYTIVAETRRLQSWTTQLQLARDLSLEPGALRRPDRPAAGSPPAVPPIASGPAASGIDNSAEPSPQDVALLRSMEGRLQAIGDRMTGTIRLVVTAADPALAARVANRWMEIALDDQVRRKRGGVEAALAATSAFRASFGSSDPAAASGKSDSPQTDPQRADLQPGAAQSLASWQQALQVQLDLQKPDFLVVSRAAPPAEPSSPRWFGLLSVAVLGSLAVALALASLLDALRSERRRGWRG